MFGRLSPVHKSPADSRRGPTTSLSLSPLQLELQVPLILLAMVAVALVQHGEAQTPTAFRSMSTLANTEACYRMDGEPLAFFKAVTGIDDEAALKAHIISIQHEGFQASSVLQDMRVSMRY